MELQEDQQLFAALNQLLGHGNDQALLMVVALDNVELLAVAGDAGFSLRLKSVIAAAVTADCAPRPVFRRNAGQQMLVPLGAMPLAEAQEMAARLARIVAECRLSESGRSYALTARVSLVAAALAAPRTPERLLQLADAATVLTQDRLAGGQSTFLADDEQLAAMVLNAEHMLDLPAALDESRLRLFGQEIVPLDPAAPPGREFEVLVQLADRDGTAHPPAAFIDRAERSVLIEMLDRHIVRSAILGHVEQLRQSPGVRLSINLSGRSLGNPELWPFIAGVLDESGLDPARFQFEITETAAILDMAAAQANVRALRAAGCRVALDDFGAGFSGLSYLNSFPVDVIKVDGGLLPNVTDPDSTDALLVPMVVRLGRALGIEVVVEHVDSRATLDTLRGMGVRKVQGFLFSRPENLCNLLENQAVS